MMGVLYWDPHWKNTLGANGTRTTQKKHYRIIDCVLYMYEICLNLTNSMTFSGSEKLD